MAIQANELRIGNWVQNDADYKWQIETLEEFYDLFNEQNKNRVEPYPIPLTPELIQEKCGTGKYKSCGYAFTLNGITVTSQDEDEEGNPIKDYVFHVHIDHAYKGIYFLHELQNAIFALSGEELEINL